MSVCLTATAWLVAVSTSPASALVNHAPTKELVPPLPGPSRIALYGDSLVSEAAQDFSFLAAESGASVRVRTYPGTAICDYFPSMAADARGWHPTEAVLAFSGDAFTSCMAGVQLGSPPYYAKYGDDAQAAISIFRSVGTKVVLVGLPRDVSPGLSQNAASLNGIYQSLSDNDTGVTYDDAGEAVMAHGQFAWTLPCLPGEPCTGPRGTNVVRSPDGVHFCPNGKTTLVGGLEECDVYSSGAIRFASAMLVPALTPAPAPPTPAPVVTRAQISAIANEPPAACGTELSHVKRPPARHRTHALSKRCRTASPRGD
jgi:hypothetical protein